MKRDRGLLDDLCNVDYGTRVVRRRDGGVGYPVYGGGGPTFNMDTFNREDSVVVARFGMSPECTRIVTGRFFLNDSGLTVSSKNGALEKRFLDYQLLSLNDTIYNLGKGSAQRNLDVPAFRQLQIFAPPLPEQKRIVSILDKALENIALAKANTERNISNARELATNAIEDILRPQAGWATCTFGDLIEIKHGFAFKSQYFRSAGTYVLLTPGNFFESGGFRQRGNKQKYYVGEIPAGYVLEKDDLLVAMTEQAPGLLGSPALVPESGRFLHNQRLGLVNLKQPERHSKGFLFHLFNLPRVRAEIHATANGVKVRHTSPAKIAAVRICVPPSKSEEEQLVQRIEQLKAKTNELAEALTSKLLALTQLRRSLLDAAFRGDL